MSLCSGDCTLLQASHKDKSIVEERIQKNNSLLQPPSMNPRFFAWHDDSIVREKLSLWLPSMEAVFWHGDWSPQLKATESWATDDSNTGIQYLLENEFVAWFVWFLFTQADPHVKYATLALTRISSGTYEATKMATIDNTSRDNLLQRVLYSENPEVQRQACCALAFVCGCNYVKDLTLEAGVLNRLLELAKHGYDSPRLAWPALFAVRYLAKYDKCKLERPLFNEEWLPFLLGLLNQNYGNHEIMGVLEEACWIVAIIVRGHEDIIKTAIDLGLIPLIVKLSSSGDQFVEAAAVGAISSVTFGATWFQIREIVEMGCLKALYAQLGGYHGDHGDYYGNAELYIDCLDGIENILIAGDSSYSYLEGPRNMYAKQIDDKDPGWSAITMFMNLNSSCLLVHEKVHKIVNTYFSITRDKSVEEGKLLLEQEMEWQREMMEDDEEEIECSFKDEEGTKKKRKTSLGLSEGGAVTAN